MKAWEFFIMLFTIPIVLVLQARSPAAPNVNRRVRFVDGDAEYETFNCG